MKRRLVLLSGLPLALPSFAQSFPDRPIKFVVPFPPGGNLDFLARVLQPRLQENLKQPIVIENKAGAGGAIGAAYVAKQPADGYTIFLGNTGTIALNPVTYTKLPYDPIKDFVAVAQVATNSQVAVINAQIPAKTLKEFIAYVKANPRKISAAVAGSGSSLHFSTEMVNRSAGTDMLLVFYKGSGPAVNDLLGGQVHFFMDAPPSVMEHVKAGKLRAIAVTGKTRIPALPDVPTFEQAGLKGLDASGFQGVFAPAGTPQAIVDRLSQAVMASVSHTETRARFYVQGLEATPTNSKQFTVFVKEQAKKWADLAKIANIKAE